VNNVYINKATALKKDNPEELVSQKI
jgi:hypothetical protein